MRGGITLLSLYIEESNVKNFMNRLLLEDIFEDFELRGAEIAAQLRVSVSGEVEPEGFITWGQAKPLITAIIKNGPRPRYMKIIFAGSREMVAAVHENAQALFINMTYENGQVTFTTACAQKQFALDKTLDTRWDAWVSAYFRQNGIIVKETI